MTTTVIHVRFAPDGTVFEIGERPESIDANQWFAKLSGVAAGAFQALSGGRGVFRIDRAALDALKGASLH